MLKREIFKTDQKRDIFRKGKKQTNERKNSFSVRDENSQSIQSISGKRRFYIPPTFEVTEVKLENCFCASFVPEKQATFTEQKWSEREIMDGGHIEF